MPDASDKLEINTPFTHKAIEKELQSAQGIRSTMEQKTKASKPKKPMSVPGFALRLATILGIATGTAAGVGEVHHRQVLDELARLGANRIVGTPSPENPHPATIVEKTISRMKLFERFVEQMRGKNINGQASLSFSLLKGDETIPVSQPDQPDPLQPKPVDFAKTDATIAMLRKSQEALEKYQNDTSVTLPGQMELRYNWRGNTTYGQYDLGVDILYSTDEVSKTDANGDVIVSVGPGLKDQLTVDFSATPVVNQGTSPLGQLIARSPAYPQGISFAYIPNYQVEPRSYEEFTKPAALFINNSSNIAISRSGRKLEKQDKTFIKEAFMPYLPDDIFDQLSSQIGTIPVATPPPVDIAQAP